MTLLEIRYETLARYFNSVARQARAIQWRMSMGQPADVIQEERDALRPLLDTIEDGLKDVEAVEGTRDVAREAVKVIIDRKIAAGENIAVGVPLSWELIDYGLTELGVSYSGLFAKLPPSPPAPPVPPPPEVPIPERTIEFWLDKGYTREQAAHITVWVKKHEMTPTPATIEEILKELEVKPETELSKAWREFAEKPDIITALGLLPSSTIESFSRVFTGYSYIDDEPAEARKGDQQAVVLIVGGLAIGTMGAVIKALPLIVGLPAAKAAASSAAAGTAMKGMIKIPGLSTLTKVMLGGLLISQLDVVCWGFGICPTRARDKIEGLIGSTRSSLITLSKKVKDREWTSARTIADNIKALLNQTRTEMEGINPQFWEDAGFSLDDLKTTFDTMQAELQTYLDDYPQLAGIAPTFPKEFLLEDVQVEDGDTLVWPGHPEAANRIRIIGIDAHESETAAGIEETAYLKSLIEHRQVRILTHQYHDPEKTIDIYGRLLGGVFLGQTDIALAMLEHFGKALLPPTKYQDKYRWIDWDLYKRTAAAAKGPAVTEFKIYIDSVPSNAKLFIDGRAARHNTPSDEVELKDVMDMLTPGEHVFKATKGGKEASVTVTIVEGANPDILLTLKAVGLEPEPPVLPPEEVPPEVPPVEVPEVVEFRISILSTPSRARLFVDGTYTHHLTPSNEKELSDVMELFTPGKHTLRFEKGGKAVEKEVDIVAGDNGEIFVKLDVVGLPRSKDNIEKEIAAARVLLEKLEAELAAL